MSAIQYSGAARRAEAANTLFAGLTFWLARIVPSRSRYKDEIIAHGGALTNDENEADIRIYDHLKKKGIPAGTHSYTFIDASIENGVLADKNEHLAGAAQEIPQNPGNSSQPAKARRTPFTKEDDCVLWDHVKAHIAAGGTDGGNKIYQELARIKPRHTSQSWRDRWIKYLRDKDERPVPSSNTDPVAPAPYVSAPSRPTIVKTTGARDQRAASRENSQATVGPSLPVAEPQDVVPQTSPSPPESAEDADARGIVISAQDEVKLFREAGDIMVMRSEAQDEAWEAFANQESNTHYSAGEWKMIWDTYVGPIFKRNVDRVIQAKREGTPECQTAATVEAPESPSNRAKANSSRRVTSRPTNMSNSQSTGSQPTSQELVSTSKAGTKRKRDDEPSEDMGRNTRSRERSLPNESVPKHIEKGKGKAVEKEDAGGVEDDPEDEDEGDNKGDDEEDGGNNTRDDEEDEGDNTGDDEEDESLFIEDKTTIDEHRAPSPSLTEPRYGNVGEDSLQKTRQDRRVQNDRAAPCEDDEHASHAATVARMKVVRKQARAKAHISLPSVTREREPPSSNFSTTPPGATARQYVLSPTPRQNQPNSSSEFTTTTPGNTAPNHLASSAPEPSPEIDDSEESPESRAIYAFRKKCRGMGCSVDEINEALEAATNMTEYAERAITHLHGTGSLPQDVQGVWTEQDDHDVMSNDSRERKRVEVKHTSALRNLRLKYLDKLLNGSDSD